MHLPKWTYSNVPNAKLSPEENARLLCVYMLPWTLDLNTDEGLSLAKNVIEISDVVTNNFRGDRMGKWGLDYDNLKKIKPDIIALSMPMMGSDGPHQDYGGNGINIIAGAGISSITGYPD